MPPSLRSLGFAGPVLFLGTFILTWIHSRPLTEWAYADWVATSAEFRQSLLLVGCLAAASAAWVASTIASPRHAMCPAGSRRRGLPLVLHHVGSLSVLAIAGQVTGLAPLLMWTARNATYGHLQGWVVVGALVSLVAFLAVGYLVGLLVPSVLAVAVAASLAFASVVLVGYNGLAASPVWPFGMATGLRQPSSLTAFRVTFFALIAVLGTAAAAWWLRERSTRWTVELGAGLAVFVVPVLVIGGIANRRDTTLVEGSPSTPVCDVSGGVTVCVDPALSDLVHPLALTVGGIARALGPPGRPYLGRVVDAATGASPRSGQVVLDLQTQDRRRWLEYAAFDVAAEVAGVYACHAGGGTLRPTAVSEAVASRVLELSGLSTDRLPGPASSRAMKIVTEMSPAQFHAYLSREMQSIHECRAPAIPDPSG